MTGGLATYSEVTRYAKLQLNTRDGGKDRTGEGSSPPTTPSGVTRQEIERRNTTLVEEIQTGKFL